MKCEGKALAIGLTDVMSASMVDALKKAGFKAESIHSFSTYEEAVCFLEDERGAVLALLDCGDQEFSEAKDERETPIQALVVALTRQNVRIILVNRNPLNMIGRIPVDYTEHLPMGSDRIDEITASGLKRAIRQIPDPKKV